MPSAPVISCKTVGRVFKTYRRQDGFAGIFRNLFNREVTEFHALAGIELEIRAGEFVGLIGANGAGKTTLVKVLAGIIPASSGSATLFDRDCFDLKDEHKRRISVVMGQRSQLWWDIPPIDSFRLLREIYEVDRAVFEERVAAYAERLQVVPQLRTQLRQLSLGQRMKMEIIGAFLHDPELVFLDEPTIGLDLVSQETIRDFLRELNTERQVTVLLTSHDMADIEQTCERLLILEEGRLLFDGDLVDLQRRLVGHRAIQIHLEPGSAARGAEAAALAGRHGGELVAEAPLSLSFSIPAENAQPFVKELFDLLEVRDLAVERQPLESLIREVFRGRSLDA